MLISKLYNILSLKNTKKAVFKNDFMHGDAVVALLPRSKKVVALKLGINWA